MGSKMIKLVFRLNGEVINIGEWNYNIVIDKDSGDELTLNPLPDGAASSEEEVIEVDGGLFAASDYSALRATMYPGIKEQLDAFWKGGEDAEAMRIKIMKVKSDMPKPS